MNREIPAPWLGGILAVLVLVVGLLLWRFYVAPPAMPAGISTPANRGTTEQKMEMLRRTREFEARDPVRPSPNAPR